MRMKLRTKLKTIKNKIILIFMAVTVFQIAVVAFFALFQLKPHITGIYEDHQKKMTDALLFEISDIKKNIESYSVNMIGDELIQDFLSSKTQNAAEPGSYGLSAALRNKVLSYTNYDNRIKGIYLIDLNNRIYSNAIDYSVSNYIIQNEERISRTGASPLWCSDYNKEDIIFCRIVNNNTTDLNQKIGSLYIVIDRDILLEAINQFIDTDEEKYMLKSMDGYMQIGNITESTTVLNNSGHYLIRDEQFGDFTLTTWIDKDIVNKPIYTIIKILFSELFLLLALSGGLIVFLSGRLTKPLSDIRAIMGQLGRGNIGVKVPVTRDDEIGLLAATMNRMSRRIEELVTKIKEDERQQRMLELKAMQYQINPHFLYNTLDSVCMYARKNEDYEIAEMVTALSNYFRMSLSQGQEVIRLQDEVQYALYYLEIQNIRFPNQIKWEINMEKDLETLYVLKFILQPLIENSINHGIRNAQSDGMITISAFTKDEKVIIEVLDNGNGMLPEELEQLIDAINKDENQNRDPFSGGFGMRNVHQRLKLYYGEESGLQIYSIWEEGTKITIEIPKAAMTKVQ